jgi:NhaA family Na+:H+ antiporter
MPESRTHLPPEAVDWISKPFKRFLRIEALGGIAMFVSAIAALVLANTTWSEQFLGFWQIHAGFAAGAFEFSRSLKYWINDALMTLFFFVIALELKRELVLGELKNPQMAAFPFAAAVGGMVVPAGLYLLVAGDGPGASGWGTVMSTDTAFVIGCLALLGSRIPASLRLFLLALAIFDDVGAILVVAIGYGDTLNWYAMGAAALGFGTVTASARAGVRSIPVYFAIGGCIWLAIDASGIHATLTGVILGLMTPARSWVSNRRLNAIFDRVIAYPPGDEWTEGKAARRDIRQAGVAAREALSPIERLEFTLHPWVAFAIMPLFALANAGVDLQAASFDATVTAAIVAAFVVGKPAGVFLGSVLAVVLRVAVRPDELSWRLLAAGSALTGIGFTMALFIAELAFEPALLDSVKIGVMAASVISAAAGFSALMWLTTPKRRAVHIVS